jgi:HPt (histidine-containing phosphotransfer) domain-containing protein
MPMPRAEPAPVSRMAAPALRPYAAPPPSRHHRPAARAIPDPAHDGFIPLRLTDPPQAVPAPPERQAPPPEPEPLFPEDSSLLGFILGRPGKHAQNTAPPRPARLVRAAKDLVNFVRPRAAAQDAKSKMWEQPPLSAHSAPLRKTDPLAQPHGSAVEQMRPLIPGLLSSLDEGMDDVRRAFSTADTPAVEDAAARIAAKADNYGLRVLARMARCVEMAARAHDKDALANILPDLETAVERNRIALQPKR